MASPIAWSYGINFYGYLIKSTDQYHAKVVDVFARAADQVKSNYDLNARKVFSPASGLQLLPPLRRFNRRLILQLKVNRVPHAVDMRATNDILDFMQLLSTSTTRLTPAELCVHSRLTLHRVISQQLGATNALGALTPDAKGWLDKNYEPLVRYLMQLINGVFIDRNGTKLNFSLKVPDIWPPDPAKPPTSINLAAESPQIAGELIYALIEYLGDKLFQVPSYDPTPGQTAYVKYACYVAKVIEPKIEAGPPWTYTSGSATHDAYDIAGAVIAFASQSVEGTLKSSIGTLIRGVSVAGVGNEALAEIAATAVSVAAKKLVEAFTQRVLIEFIADSGIPGTFKDKVFDRLREIIIKNEQ